jgi:hypothetical protein
MSSRNKSVRRAGIALVIAALATVGLIVVGVMRSLGSECEVCMTFNGRTECRTAVGVDSDEATRTAIQNACALISGGMTQTIQCQNRQPDSVSCK